MLRAWGLISPQLIQKLMSLFKHDLENAKNEDLDMTMINTLAALGSNGDYPPKHAQVTHEQHWQAQPANTTQLPGTTHSQSPWSF